MLIALGGTIALVSRAGEGGGSATSGTSTSTTTADRERALAKEKRKQEEAAREEAAKQREQEKAAAGRAAAAPYRESLEKLVADGVIYSVDYEARTMRIDPMIWAGLSVDQKRNMIEGFYQYFVLMGQEWTVRILSNRNDDVFADCGPFSGSTIKR